MQPERRGNRRRRNSKERVQQGLGELRSGSCRERNLTEVPRHFSQEKQVWTNWESIQRSLSLFQGPNGKAIKKRIQRHLSTTLKSRNLILKKKKHRKGKLHRQQSNEKELKHDDVKAVVQQNLKLSNSKTVPDTNSDTSSTVVSSQFPLSPPLDIPTNFQTKVSMAMASKHQKKLVQHQTHPPAKSEEAAQSQDPSDGIRRLSEAQNPVSRAIAATMKIIREKEEKYGEHTQHSKPDDQRRNSSATKVVNDAARVHRGQVSALKKNQGRQLTVSEMEKFLDDGVIKRARNLMFYPEGNTDNADLQKKSTRTLVLPTAIGKEYEELASSLLKKHMVYLQPDPDEVDSDTSCENGEQESDAPTQPSNSAECDLFRGDSFFKNQRPIPATKVNLAIKKAKSRIRAYAKKFVQQEKQIENNILSLVKYETEPRDVMNAQKRAQHRIRSLLLNSDK